MPIAQTWIRSRRSVLDFLFPPECPLCHEHPADVECAHPALCRSCRTKLASDTMALCLGCGAPLGPYQRPTSQCVHCYRDRFAFSRAWSLGVFDGDLQLAVLKAKARQGELLTIALADFLFDLHRDELMSDPPDLVVGVPHHWTERLTNTHHASETAAATLAARIGVPPANSLVIKLRRTKQQASLVPSDRRKNLTDVFRLRREQRVRGKCVLLVDDVLTTGITAHRIASLLMRQGGAKDVKVCVLARGVGRT